MSSSQSLGSLSGLSSVTPESSGSLKTSSLVDKVSQGGLFNELMVRHSASQSLYSSGANSIAKSAESSSGRVKDDARDSVDKNKRADSSSGSERHVAKDESGKVEPKVEPNDNATLKRDDGSQRSKESEELKDDSPSDSGAKEESKASSDGRGESDESRSEGGEAPDQAVSEATSEQGSAHESDPLMSAYGVKAVSEHLEGVSGEGVASSEDDLKALMPEADSLLSATVGDEAEVQLLAPELTDWAALLDGGSALDDSAIAGVAGALEPVDPSLPLIDVEELTESAPILPPGGLGLSEGLRHQAQGVKTIPGSAANNPLPSDVLTARFEGGDAVGGKGSMLRTEGLVNNTGLEGQPLGGAAIGGQGAQALAQLVSTQLKSTMMANPKGEALVEGVSAKGPLSLSPSAAGTLMDLPRAAPALSQYQSSDLKGALFQTNVQTPVGQPQWSRAVGERVLWLAAQNLSAAEIHLDPAELGPMQVRITISQDQASVAFTSQHVAVREALDQSSFRLREMFDNQGLDLVNVDVSDQSSAQHSETGEGRESAAASDGLDGGVEEEVLIAQSNPLSIGLINQYV